MRKYAIYAAVVGGGLLCFVLAGYWLLRDVSSTAWSHALVGDIFDYAAENEGRLPHSWKEFLKWSDQNHGYQRWSQEELNGAYKLLWGVTLKESEGRLLIRAVDPDLLKLEHELNKKLRRWMTVERAASEVEGKPSESS